MKKLSDEELVGYAFQYCIPFGDGSLGNPKAELLSRLAKGRKAIEMLTYLRKSISDFNGHGMPGFTDRAMAYTCLAKLDTFLDESIKDNKKE